MGELLVVNGSSWAVRKAALAMVMNARPPQQEISNDGDTFLVVITTQQGVDTKEFIVGGPSFESTFGPEKTPGTGQAVWEGDVLVLRVQMADKSSETRRWLEGDRLHETTTLTRRGKSATLK